MFFAAFTVSRLSIAMVSRLRVSLPYTALFLLGTSACSDSTDPSWPAEFPSFASSTSLPAYATVEGVTLQNGGYGSSLVVDPHAPGYFYSLTDRGPNYIPSDGKIAILLPEFTPHIGRFKLEGDTLRRVSMVELRNAAGHLVSGLPNPAGAGGTGEIAVSVTGTPLGTDPDGIDSEGLVALKDGTFWISDEYGPYMAHFAASGNQIERVAPFSTGRSLPRVLAKRRPNRGMEGLTMLPDGITLLGTMQSPLDNPQVAGRASRLLRFVTFNTQTGATKEYVDILESSASMVCEVAALTQDSFLILERDGNFRNSTTAPATIKRIYKVSFGAATNITDPTNSATGKLFGGKTLEQLSPGELTTNGITPFTKTLVADLLTLGYPHDKAEGLAIIDDHTIAVSNDDDFGVTDASGHVARKELPGSGKTDFNSVYFVKVTTPLR